MDFTGERMIPEFNKGNTIYVEHITRYLFASQFVKNKIVLDIACGSGYGAKELLEAGAKKVIGVDISEEAIEYCKKNYPNESIEFVVGGVEKIPLEDNSIDVVVSFETIEHVNAESQKLFLEESKRVLEESGVLIISTPNCNFYQPGNPFHIKELSEKEFKDILKKYFSTVEFYHQSDEIGQSVYIVAICSDCKYIEKEQGATLFSKVNIASFVNQRDKETKIFKSIIQKKEFELQQKIQEIQHRDLELQQKKQEIQHKEHELQYMRDSFIWKTLGGLYEAYIRKFQKHVPKSFFRLIDFSLNIFHPIKFFTNCHAFLKMKMCGTTEKIISIKHNCNPAKKTIIFIDCNVPTHDKDAGSRTIYQYVKLFLEMNFNVIFIPDDFNSPQPYTRELERLGVKVLWGLWYMRNWRKWLIDNEKHIDYFFLNRAGNSVKYLEIIKDNMQAKVIYYPMDITYIRELRQYKITKEKYLLKNIEEHKKLESYMFKNSDVVITISEYEKDVLNKEFPEAKVFIIPTFIYDCDFPLVNGKFFNERQDLLFVGGFRHLPNADGIKWFINNIFPMIKKEIPDIKINIIGSHTPEEISNLASPNIKILGFVSDKKLEENYSKTRIVIAPLRYGAGVKGKIIEAIAYGIPVVTTVIGAEGIIRKENVLLVGDNEQEFAKKVIELYSNSSMWHSLRNCQVQYAKSYLSKKSAKKIVREILDKA